MKLKRPSAHKHHDPVKLNHSLTAYWSWSGNSLAQMCLAEATDEQQTAPGHQHSPDGLQLFYIQQKQEILGVILIYQQITVIPSLFFLVPFFQGVSSKYNW